MMAIVDLGKYVLVTVLLEWVKDVKSLMMLDVSLNQKQRVMVTNFMSEYAGKFESILKDKKVPVNINAFRWLSQRGIGGFEVTLYNSKELRELLPFSNSVAALTLESGVLTSENVALLRHFIRLSSIYVDMISVRDGKVLTDFVNAIIVHHPRVRVAGLWNYSDRIHLMLSMHAHSRWDEYSGSLFVRRTASWYCRPESTLRYSFSSEKDLLCVRSQQPDPLTSLTISRPVENAEDVSILLQNHTELEEVLLVRACPSDVILSLATYSANLTCLYLNCTASIDYTCLHTASFRLKTLILDGEADGVIPTVWTDAFLHIEHVTLTNSALSPDKLTSLLSNLCDLTGLNMSGSSYEASIVGAMTGKKLKCLNWESSGTDDAFQLLLRRAAGTLLTLQVDPKFILKTEIRRAIFQSLLRLQSLTVFTSELQDSDFPEDWVEETIEMFRPRLCELTLTGWGGSMTRPRYTREVIY